MSAADVRLYHLTLALLIGLVFGVDIALAVSAPEVARSGPLPIDAILAAKTIVGAVTISRNGQRFAYSLRNPSAITVIDANANDARLFTDTGVPVDARNTDILITDVGTGATENLTEGKASNWGPVWSPNGRFLAFYSDRDGSERLWIYDLATHTLHRASEAIVHPYLVLTEVPEWSPDSRKVLVKLLPKGLSIKEAEYLAHSPRMERDGVTASRLGPTVEIYRPSDNQQSPWIKAELSDLGLIDVANGEVTRVATRVNPVWYGIAPAADYVAYATINSLMNGNDLQNLFDLIVLLPDGSEVKVATDIQERGPSMAISWSPNGEWLSYTDSAGDCYVASVTGQLARKVTQSPHPSFRDVPIWDSASKNLFFIVEARELWRVSMTNGGTKRLGDIPGHLLLQVVGPRPRGRFWSPDGERTLMIATLDDDTKQSGFFTIDLTTG